MKNIATIIALLMASYCMGQKAEKEAVKEAFENYKSAILNDNGEEAVKHVDRRTIQYYSDILEKVKRADSATVESFSFLDKLMVLIIRHRAAKEDIMSFDGKSLLVYAIEKGMVGKNSVADNSIGKVIVNDEFAKGQFVNNKLKTSYYFHFYKEENEWKIDLTSVFAISGAALEFMIASSGKSETDYIFDILELLTGEKPGPEIWMPTEG